MSVARNALQSEVVAGGFAFLTVGTLGAENGGYFSTTWGWVAVPLFALLALLVASGAATPPGRAELAVLGAIAALVGWILLSSRWSASATRTMLESERSLVYLAAVAVGLVVSRRAGGRALIVGTWLAIVGIAVDALLTRLFPQQLGFVDPIADNRLSTPVGYWNGLAVLTAMGTLLAFGLAARAGPLLRPAAAASTVVLPVVLYFTFSRGGWLSLFVGAAVAVALDRRRLQLVTTALVLLPWAAVAVHYASRSSALTSRDASVAAAARDGHALAVLLIGLMAVAAVAAVALDYLETVVHVRPRTQRLYAAALAACLVATAVAGLGRHGSPAAIARHSWRSFSAPVSMSASPDLRQRLFQLSGSGRIEQWRVAVAESRAHPWLGSGAGTYGETWFAQRPWPAIVHDAHNLYLETLAELGRVGLALLALAFGTPLAVAAVRRASPYSAVAVASFTAFAVHATVDWDWELPVIVVAALVALVAVLGEREGVRAPRARWAVAVAALALAGASLVGLIGNVALAASGRAAAQGDWQRAAQAAQRAHRFAPWSSEPWRKLAVAQAGGGHERAARASLQTAVRIDPADWSLWFQLAQVSTGKERRAAEAAVRRLNPGRNDTEASPTQLAAVVAP